MPTFALLGATGSTGSAILRCYYRKPVQDLNLKVFVRSKAKLLKAFPDLESTTAFKATIIEGTPGDNAETRECLRDVDVVLGCIGTNAPTKGMTLIHDTAQTIISVLKEHKNSQGSNYKPPTVIQLRSSSLNPYAALPWIARNMAWFIFHHIYKDLDRACKLYEQQPSDLLSYIFVDPPSIHDAEGTTATGHKIFLDVSQEKQESAIMYADLGEAFVEIAERRDEFLGKGVFVSATGEVNMTWGPLMGYMGQGIKSRVL